MPTMAASLLPALALLVLLLPRALTGGANNVASAWTLNSGHQTCRAGKPPCVRRTGELSEIGTRTPAPHYARRAAADAATAALHATADGSGSSTGSPIMAAYDADARGRSLQDRGALNAAVVAFAEAADLHPSPERHLRLGLALEENGEPARAIAAYDAARDGSTDPVLRHDVALKIGHVWADDLGDVAKGIWHADAAMSEEGYADSPAAIDRKAVFLAAQGKVEEAMELWDAALAGEDAAAALGRRVVDGSTETYGGGVDDARFFRAVARSLVGREAEAYADLDALPPDMTYMADSLKYIATHPPRGADAWNRLFSGTYTFLSDALQAARPDGLIAEFGVFHGKSIRLLAAMVDDPSVPLDGFDTFEGIPEAWGDEAAGTYTAAAEIPEAPPNVNFHVGLFSETLPPYVASLPPPKVLPARLINVDCDLYGGTVEILHYLADRIGPGTVIVFDEYLMHPTWPEDEYRAFQEACEKFGWEYEYLTYSLVSKQAVVRITGSASFVGPAATPTVVAAVATAVEPAGSASIVEPPAAAKQVIGGAKQNLMVPLDGTTTYRSVFR